MPKATTIHVAGLPKRHYLTPDHFIDIYLSGLAQDHVLMWQASSDAIRNGGFETGVFAPYWTPNSAAVINTDQHSGIYCAILYSGGSALIDQTLASPVPVSAIASLMLWLKRNGSGIGTPYADIYIFYVGGTYTSLQRTATVGWTGYDLKPYLDAAKSVSSISIRWTLATGYNILVDDVSLIQTKNYWQNFPPLTGSAWLHALLSAIHSDTLAASPIAGDIIIANNTPKWSRLPKGTDGQVLTLASGLPTWAIVTDYFATVQVRSDFVPCYRKYRISTTTWSDWTSLSGTCIEIASHFVIESKLYVVVRNILNQLWYKIINLTDDSIITDWTTLADLTPYGVITKLRVSSTDTTPDHLFDKLVAGAGITLTKQNPAGNENIKIDATGGGSTTLWDIWFTDKYKTLLKPNSAQDVIAKTAAAAVTIRQDWWSLFAGVGVSQFASIKQNYLSAGYDLPSFFFDKNPTFQVYWMMDNLGVATSVYIVIANNDEITTTHKKFGLKIVNTTAYILTSDGTTESTTVLATGLVAGVLHRTIFKLNSGGSPSVDAYFDGGAAVNKTTNIPTGSAAIRDLNLCLRLISSNNETNLNVRTIPLIHDF